MPVALKDEKAAHAAVMDTFGFACGVLRMRPDDFWGATPFEMTASMEAFARFHGLSRKDDFSAEDARMLRQLLDAGMKR
jgi:hypothetical protein